MIRAKYAKRYEYCPQKTRPGLRLCSVRLSTSCMHYMWMCHCVFTRSLNTSGPHLLCCSLFVVPLPYSLDAEFKTSSADHCSKEIVGTTTRDLDPRHGLSTTAWCWIKLDEFCCQADLLYLHDSGHVPTAVAVVRRRKYRHQ